MSDTDFFAEVANGFKFEISKYPTNESYRRGAQYAQLYAIGCFDDALVIIVEVLPKTYPEMIFGLVRYRWQLTPFLVGDGPYEIGQNVAQQNILEPGISLVPIRELNADYIHWNRSDRGISDRVPHRPEEIQGFRWPRGFVEL